MTGPARILSGWEATTALARLSLRRVVRGRAIWVSLGMGLLPCLLAAFMAKDRHDTHLEHWDALIGVFMPLLAIIPPMLVASSLSDEIDDKTSAYLWSRAVPRWSIVTGKLLGLLPVVIAPMVLGLVLCWVLLGGAASVPAGYLTRGMLGFAVGAAGAATVSAMFAAIAPRFAVPLAMGWLLLDAIIGALSMNLHVIAVTFGPRAIARGEETASAAISIAVLTALSLAIAVRRVDRIE